MNNTDKSIEVNVSYNIGNEENSDKAVFESIEYANWYILQYRKLYLLIVFERYVMKCKEIYLDQSARNLVFDNISLDRCLRYSLFLQNEMLAYIVDCMLKLRTDMIKILPSHHHPEFIKLTAMYKEIENFCKNIIK